MKCPRCESLIVQKDRIAVCSRPFCPVAYTMTDLLYLLEDAQASLAHLRTKPGEVHGGAVSPILDTLGKVQP